MTRDPLDSGHEIGLISKDESPFFPPDHYFNLSDYRGNGWSATPKDKVETLQRNVKPAWATTHHNADGSTDYTLRGFNGSDETVLNWIKAVEF